MKRPNQIALELPPEQRVALDRIARTEGRTRSEIIRAAVADYLLRRPVALHDTQPEGRCSQCGKWALIAGDRLPGEPLCDECL